MAQGLIQAGCRAKTPKSPNIKETEGESAPVPALALVYAVWYDCHGRSPPSSAGVPAAADIAAVSDEVGVRGGRVSEREMERVTPGIPPRARLGWENAVGLQKVLRAWELGCQANRMSIYGLV